jgi:hypothetical protein
MKRITGIYIRAYVQLWQYLFEFILEWEMFQTKIVEKFKTILCLVTPPLAPKSW